MTNRNKNFPNRSRRFLPTLIVAAVVTTVALLPGGPTMAQTPGEPCSGSIFGLGPSNPSICVTPVAGNQATLQIDDNSSHDTNPPTFGPPSISPPPTSDDPPTPGDPPGPGPCARHFGDSIDQRLLTAMQAPSCS